MLLLLFTIVLSANTNLVQTVDDIFWNSHFRVDYVDDDILVYINSYTISEDMLYSTEIPDTNHIYAYKYENKVKEEKLSIQSNSLIKLKYFNNPYNRSSCYFSMKYSDSATINDSIYVDKQSDSLPFSSILIEVDSNFNIVSMTNISDYGISSVTDMQFDSSGNKYITGLSTTSIGSDNSFILLKLEKENHLVWVKEHIGKVSFMSSIILIDSCLYTSIYYDEQDCNKANRIVSKLSVDGSEIWTLNFESQQMESSQLVLGEDNNLYLSQFASTPNIKSATITKIASDGNLIGSQKIDMDFCGDIYMTYADSKGNVYLSFIPTELQGLIGSEKLNFETRSRYFECMLNNDFQVTEIIQGKQTENELDYFLIMKGKMLVARKIKRDGKTKRVYNGKEEIISVSIYKNSIPCLFDIVGKK